MKKYVVIDFETTGFQPYPSTKVTQIAAIKIMGDKPIAKFVTYVNPEIAIPEEVVAITGITNDTVKDAPKLEEVIGSLMEFIGDWKIVSYNTEYDLDKILRPAVRDLCNGYEIPNETQCALILARSVYKGTSHKLSNLYKYLGFSDSDLKAHDALSDVIMAYAVYEKALKDSGVATE